MKTFRVRDAGGIDRDLNQETSVGIPTWKAAGDIAQTPLGRVYAESDPEAPIPLPTQVRVSWTVRGETSLIAAQELTDLVSLLDGATRLWHGKRYLTVVRLAESPPWERLFPKAAPLGYRGEHVYDLLDPYYRLTPTDESKRRTP
ncbi:hypothetical protein ACFFLM_04375 [Deinococcus oregonensis]|uniref:Uncharacterized protein n=1 Tax=Deinococcus oregonensis TaxID=1805970 RepID=A0ABV6AUN3_9DEIO